MFYRVDEFKNGTRISSRKFTDLNKAYAYAEMLNQKYYGNNDHGFRLYPAFK